MKKILAIAAILAAIIAAAAISFHAGQQDVILNQEPWILDFDKPENGDYVLHIRIHDQWHEYTGYIG